MKNRKLLLAVIAVVAAITVMCGIYALTRPEPSTGEKNITVQVIHKDGSEKKFTYTTQEEYLGEYLLSEGLIEGEEGDYGLYVKKVNGITADYDVDKTYWAFYIGEEYAMSGVDKTSIVEGESYSFKVEK